MEISENDKQDSLRKIKLAGSLIAEGKYEEGIRQANEALSIDFNSAEAMFYVGYALMKTQRFGLAYNILKRVSQLQPQRPEVWNNMGMCHQETWNLDDAELCFKEAIKRDPSHFQALENLALVSVNRCHPEEALKWLDKVAFLKRSSWESKDTKAMALLMKRDWSGWKLYRETAGTTKQRELRTYCDPEEPMWNGESGKVVVYGNQGIGDEIAFSSCIPDALKNSEIIIDCDKKLEGLFRRSFPGAKVYGTRFSESRDWDHLIDYSIPSDCLPSMFRLRNEDFTGRPFLTADPERRTQWRALFNGFKKPVIGIAWTGGLKITGARKRSLPLNAFLPILKAVDATWVSLEYKDRRDEIEELELEYGIKVLDYPRATKTLDYDDNAGLVAELDLVISVTTAVVHLSGGLGKECWCIAPNKPRFFYGVKGDDLPWYRSVSMFRQTKDGTWPIKEIEEKLRLKYDDLDVQRATNRLLKLAEAGRPDKQDSGVHCAM
jgi:Tfp pilus assembly protein PilF